jgi:hypothetical protein
MTLIKEMSLAGQPGGGVLRAIRDCFLNTQGRTQPIYWYIGSLEGFDDISSYLPVASASAGSAAAAVAADESSVHALPVRPVVQLHNVVVHTYCENNNLVVLIGFMYNQQYYMMNKTVRLSTSDKTPQWQFKRVPECTLKAQLPQAFLDRIPSRSVSEGASVATEVDSHV